MVAVTVLLRMLSGCYWWIAQVTWHKASFECVLSCFKQYFSQIYSVFICVSFCMFCLLYVCILCISVFMYFMYSVCLSVCLSLALCLWAKLPEINCDVISMSYVVEFFLKKNLDLAIQWLPLHWVYSSINPRKSGPFMALLVVLVAKYDPVLPEIDMPVHNGSDKMHRQWTQQLKKITPQK